MKWTDFYDGLIMSIDRQNVLEAIAYRTGIKVNILGHSKSEDTDYISKEEMQLWIQKIKVCQPEEEEIDDPHMVWTIQIKQEPSTPPGFNPGIYKILVYLEGQIWCHHIDHMLLDEEAPANFPDLDRWNHTH